MMLLDLLLLIGLAICVLGSARLWMRHVLPTAARMREPEVFIDVWLPISLALPFAALALATPNSVAGVGWAPVAAPIALALFIAPAMMLARPHQAENPALDERTERGRLIWSRNVAVGAGVVLLLLAASHTLTVWVGQCLFAIVATLMWLNVPHVQRGRGRVAGGAGESSGESNAGAHEADNAPNGSTLGLLALGALAGVLVAMLAPGWRWIGLACLCLLPAVVLAAAARRLPRGRALRLALWLGAFGPLLGIGVLSAARLVPQSLAMMFSPLSTPADGRIATGFGAYVPEAVLLVLLGAGATMLVSTSRRAGPALLLVLAIAGLTTFRILGGF